MGVLLLTSCLFLDAEELSPSPELVATFEAARLKLPEPFRERVGDVVLKRATDLGIGVEMPLEYRLLNRAAFASFKIMDRELTVYDAGVRGLPTWGGSGPRAGEVASLLSGVTDVMGVAAPRDENDPAFQVAWKDFVRRVYSWEGAEVPDPFPAVDDKRVWDRFLGDGVSRLMGGNVPMEQLMVHEFGHALQLEPDSMILRMAAWSELSGFTETEGGEPADGFVGGMNKMEEVMVLIRLLMAEDAGKMVRGEKADLLAEDGARFVNRYARYDLREDYAESFRMMAYEPGRLAQIAPEKFLYLNALGWNARLDAATPGPLWYSGKELERFLPKEIRKELFGRLLGRAGRGPALSPLPMAALLRAHAGELTKDDLPQPYPVVAVPEDLPRELRAGLGNSILTVEIDGVVHVASPDQQRARQDESIRDWVSRYAFTLDLLNYRGKAAKGLRGVYEKDVVGEKDFTRRLNQYEALREFGGKVFTPEEWREWDLVEAKAHHEAGNVWVAARYSVLASEKRLTERFEEITGLAAKGESGLERARFIGTAVDLALAGKDASVVKAKTEAIPGEALGKWLRVKYFLRAAKAFGEDGSEAFLNAAKSEAADCDFPLLKKQLGAMLELE